MTLHAARIRRLIYQAHLYLGLFVGAGFVLLGITGSLLVFEQEIAGFLNSPQLSGQVEGQPVALSTVLKAAVNAQPRAYTAFRIILPREGGAYTVWSSVPKTQGGGYLVTHVHPASGQVLGTHIWGESLMGFIYKLHYTLQLGHLGETAVGVLGMLMLVSVASAIFLWWPAAGRVLRAFKVGLPARGRRLHRELHKAFGFYAAIPLFVIAFSGIYIVFPQQVGALVDSVLPVTDAPVTLRSNPPGKPIGPDRAARIASGIFPEAEVMRVALPIGRKDVYQVSLRQPGEVQESYGQTYVWIDQYSGEVLRVRDYYDAPIGDRVLDWQFSLHNGEAFGIVGRWVVFAAGFVPLVLYVTGCVLWWTRRKARRPRRRQFAAAR